MEGREPCAMDEEDYRQLLRWAASMGITDAPLDAPVSRTGLGNTLSIATFPDAGGRGLAAIRDIKQGELILRVPYAALLGVQCAKNDPDFAKLLQEFPELSSLQILAVYLLREVAEACGSRWFPYFQHLPRVHHMLAHFSPSEAQELQVEDAIWCAKTSSQNARKLWEQALPLLVKLGMKQRFCTYKAWLWATATISSRTLHVSWDEAGVLCPIGDLFNYDPPGTPYAGPTINDLEPLLSSDFHCEKLKPRVESFMQDLLSRSVRVHNEDQGVDEYSETKRLDGGFEPSLGSYCFYARKNYRQGQQVLLCYGQYSNLELLEHYGFVLWHNSNDAAYIRLPHCSEFGFPDNSEHEGASCYIQVGGVPSFSLLQLLRLKANPVPVRKSLGYLAIQGLQISAESEQRVRLWLAKTCRETLEALPTSMMEDVLTLLRLRGRKCCCSSDTCLAKSLVLSNDELERRTLSIHWRLMYKMTLHLCALKVREMQS